eukprot:CAMPEP_0118952192 /NCGR_PEP_ID=MMETSP1169-20130426/54463_1 /TAXON_ID=36882 /ORGANISM="Pyramimonas obovata, Strain CCMP722" /LENGTH=66 /DNA_ID=CAMNT_0006899389 /DNA_START=9 /DNA_END=207 /DNA_ORIENTATION=+
MTSHTLFRLLSENAASLGGVQIGAVKHLHVLVVFFDDPPEVRFDVQHVHLRFCAALLWLGVPLLFE